MCLLEGQELGCRFLPRSKEDQFSGSVVSDSLGPPWAAAHQASLSIINSWSWFKLMSIESVTTSNHLILHHPLLLPSVFPSIRVFSRELVLGKWSGAKNKQTNKQKQTLELDIMNCGHNINHWGQSHLLTGTVCEWPSEGKAPEEMIGPLRN